MSSGAVSTHAPPCLRRVCVSLTMATSCLLAPGARADPPRTSALTWTRMNGAEECVGAEDLATAVERRLGRRVFVPSAQADLTIDARVERRERPPGWRATIALRSAKGDDLGVRELASDEPRCTALDEPLALAIALMIDPEAALSSPRPVAPEAPLPPAPPHPAPAPAPPLAAPPPSTDMRPSRPSRPPWQLTLEAGPSFGVGLLPNAGLGFGAAAIIEPPSFGAAELYGVRWLSNDAEIAAGVGASIQITMAGLALCPLSVRPGRAHVMTCAGIEIGAAYAAGFGFDVNETDTITLVAGALRGEVSYRLWGPLVAAGGLALGVPFRRGPFYYRDPEGGTHEVFRIAPLDATATAMLGLAAP